MSWCFLKKILRRRKKIKRRYIVDILETERYSANLEGVLDQQDCLSTEFEFQSTAQPHSYSSGWSVPRTKDKSANLSKEPGLELQRPASLPGPSLALFCSLIGDLGQGECLREKMTQRRGRAQKRLLSRELYKQIGLRRRTSAYIVSMLRYFLIYL